MKFLASVMLVCSMLAVKSGEADPDCVDTDASCADVTERLCKLSMVKAACAKSCGDCVEGGEMSKWTEWEACDAPCDGGMRTRTRTCSTDDCEGHAIEEEPCNTDDCPNKWSEWEQWSPCSATCGAGESFRYRRCMYGNGTEASNIDLCDDPSDLGPLQMKECSETRCYGWSDWNTWSPCSETCDKGQTIRYRRCQAKDGTDVPNYEVCSDPTGLGPLERKDCTIRQCRSTWGPWEPYGDCSTTCGEGKKSRKRVCIGEDSCPGKDVEMTECNEETCPVLKVGCEDMSNADCSRRKNQGQCEDFETVRNTWCRKSCGTCQDEEKVECLDTVEWCDTSTEYCKLPVVKKLCCNTCLPVEEEEEQEPEGEWSPWSDWERCDVTCGGGTRKRSRSCSNNNCHGKALEDKVCGMSLCLVLGDWSPWGDCSETCGKGSQDRTRECIQGDCNPNELFENRDCDEGNCIVLGDWSDWSDCSVTCGEGSEDRTRSCIQGDCDPMELSDTRDCIKECIRMGEWTDWTPCSTSCGGGNEERVRLCMRGRCKATDLKETRECNARRCPEPKWSTWTESTPCSVTCGRGIKKRTRRCLTIEGREVNINKCARSGARGAESTQTCNFPRCPPKQTFIWTAWNQWSPCSVTCNTGNTVRYRKCTDSDGNEADNSEMCTGQSAIGPMENKQCSDRICPTTVKCREESWCKDYTKYCNVDSVKKMCQTSCGSCGAPATGTDCKWGPWVEGECTDDGRNGYRILKRREKIEAKNGGRDCVGSPTQETPCRAPDFIAATFLKMAKQEGPPQEPTSPPRPGLCSVSQRDQYGVLRLMGNRCAQVQPKSANAFARSPSGAPIQPSKKPRDIMFIVDETARVGGINFDLQLALAKAVTNRLCGTVSVGQHRTRISVLTFCESVYFQMNFKQHFERSHVLGRLDQIKYPRTSNAICFVKALEFTIKQGFAAIYGSRSDAERLAILVTDGCSSCRREELEGLPAIAEGFRKAGITLLSFIINPDETCLKKVQPLADGSRCFQIFSESWTEFRETIKRIEDGDCVSDWETSKEKTCLSI